MTQKTNEIEVKIRYDNCFEEITALIKGRAPIIWVLTHEEGRFIEEFEKCISQKHKRQMWLWSSYKGLYKYQDRAKLGRATNEEENTHSPLKALERIGAIAKPDNGMKGHCFIMQDFHNVFVEPYPRQMRDMYEHLIGTGKTIIITSPVLAHGPLGNKSGLPNTLEKQISVVKYELPNKDQIITHINEILEHMSGPNKEKSQKTKVNYEPAEIESFARALQGLTFIEIDNAISTSMTYCHGLHIEKLISDKRQLIRKSEILEFIDTPVGMADVGGLDLAKLYLQKYIKVQTDEAKEFGVEALKGIILSGIPGTGKSLLAKAIGKFWGVPLLRLDVGKVMTGLVGGSESKMRQVIDQAEAMAPAILWIDEVEKSLSGTKSSNFSDGGTLSRVFGTLLTAMEDGMEGVTIIATANDVSALPPEFIRRFNEVFFVDLPGPDERWEILGIHLAKRKRTIDDFAKHKKEILKACEDYTGAEIEKAIKDAIAAAFCEGQKKLTYKHLTTALNETKPIIQVMKDQVQNLRDAAKGQYRYASSWSIKESKKKEIKTSGGKKLDFNKTTEKMEEFVKTPKQVKEEAPKPDDRFKDIVEENEEQGDN